MSSNCAAQKRKMWGIKPMVIAQIFVNYQTLADLLIWGTIYGERTGLSLTIIASPLQPVVLRYKSRGTYDHILRSHSLDSPTWRARSPYMYPPWTGCPSYHSRHWVPFSSPPTTRRATVYISWRGLCVYVSLYVFLHLTFFTTYSIIWKRPAYSETLMLSLQHNIFCNKNRSAGF
jgi:hypothetical protein